MATRIEEAGLVFEFDDDWEVVVKWDDRPAYRDGLQKLEGSRAVDIIALSPAREMLLLIEIKDFRGHRIRNRDRIKSGSLFLEVGHKVRDSVAGVRGAARTKNDQDVADLARQIAANASLTVVLWLEEDRHATSQPTSTRRAKSRLSTLTQELKRRVRWLTPKAVVQSLATNHLSGAGIVVTRKGAV